jgi:hypothetical protein
MLSISVFSLGILFLLTSSNKYKVGKRIIHKSVKDFVYLMAAQSGISVEQASITLKSIMSYMQQHPTHPLQRAIAAIFGSKKNDDDAILN